MRRRLCCTHAANSRPTIENNTTKDPTTATSVDGSAVDCSFVLGLNALMSIGFMGASTALLLLLLLLLLLAVSSATHMKGHMSNYGELSSKAWCVRRWFREIKLTTAHYQYLAFFARRLIGAMNPILCFFFPGTILLLVGMFGP